MKCRSCRTPMENVVDHGAVIGAVCPTVGCGSQVSFRDAGFPYTDTGAVHEVTPVVSGRAALPLRVPIATHDPRPCAYAPCGKDFVPTHGLQLYCGPECRNAEHRERPREGGAAVETVDIPVEASPS